jgi:hypothetical protein
VNKSQRYTENCILFPGRLPVQLTLTRLHDMCFDTQRVALIDERENLRRLSR